MKKATFQTKKRQSHNSLLNLFLFIFLIVSLSLPSKLFSQQADLIKKITDQSNSIFKEMVDIRRDIHSHPEFPNREVRTSQIVAEKLRSYGLEVRTNVGGYGVVGILRGTQSTPVVAYRADMDCVEINLNENSSFKSTVPGAAHACGHDVHTSVGLGIAKVLSSMKNELPGTIVFIFQPAEETIEGAKRMIADGVLNNPKPDAIFALHVAPLPVGTMATTPGVGLPGLEIFTIKLNGSNALADITKGIISSISSNVGTIQYAQNMEGWQKLIDALKVEKSILSDFIFTPVWLKNSKEGESTIEGFIRASSVENYKKAKEKIKSFLNGLDSKGIQFTFESVNACPNMFSNFDLGTWSMKPLGNIIGTENAIRAYHSFPFNSEDFAYFLEKIPGHMFWLGGSNPQKNFIALPHAPMFGVDEDAILTGIKGMSNVLAQYLIQNNK